MNCKKLLLEYDGPFVVTKAYKNDSYEVSDLPESRRCKQRYSGACAVDQMKPFETNLKHEDELSASDEDQK